MKNTKMELTVSEYGSHLFDIMTTKNRSYDHWESIRAKAEPMVRKLIKLNKEMDNGGYNIVGYKDEKGNKKLSSWERILKTQEILWGCIAVNLKPGDEIWLFKNYDHEMYVTQDAPAIVKDVTENCVYIEMQGCNYEYIISIKKYEKVLLAPLDFCEDGEYTTKEYWLQQADCLKV